jgi:hypothetical protein
LLGMNVWVIKINSKKEGMEGSFPLIHLLWQEHGPRKLGTL